MNDVSKTPDDSPTSAPDAPQIDSAEMTPEQLAEAKEYGRRSLVCKLAQSVLGVVFWGVVAFGFGQRLGENFSRGNAPAFVQLNMIIYATLAAGTCVTLPLSFYSGYVLEHRFGLSQQTFFGWLKFHAKYALMQCLVVAGYLMCIYLLIWTCGALWWVLAAGVVFLINAFSLLTPVLNFRSLYKVQPLDDAKLTERLVALTQGTGLSVKRVYRLKLSAATAKTTAVMTGLGPSRSVLLGDTLLDEFAPEDIDVIFAHEVGHVVHHHLIKMLLVNALCNLAIFWICDVAIFASAHSHYAFDDYANAPPSTLPLLMFVWSLCSLVFTPLQNIAWRHFERQSDQYALNRTGKLAYISAFTKLAKINKEDPYRHPLDTVLFHMHPPISDRLAMAQQ